MQTGICPSTKIVHRLMAKRDWGWEIVRIGIGVALVAGCGLVIWNRNIAPFIQRGMGPSEALRELRLGFYKQSFEKRKEEMRRESQAAKEAAKKNPPPDADAKETQDSTK